MKRTTNIFKDQWLVRSHDFQVSVRAWSSSSRAFFYFKKSLIIKTASDSDATHFFTLDFLNHVICRFA